MEYDSVSTSCINNSMILPFSILLLRGSFTAQKRITDSILDDADTRWQLQKGLMCLVAFHISGMH